MTQRSIPYISTPIKRIWVVGGFFVFCLAAPLVAQQTADEQSEHYARGMHALRLGLYDEAVNAFQEVLQLNPQNAEAQCELGQLTGSRKKMTMLWRHISALWNCPHPHRRMALHISVWHASIIRKATLQRLKSTGNTPSPCYRRTLKPLSDLQTRTYNVESWI